MKKITLIIAMFLSSCQPAIRDNGVRHYDVRCYMDGHIFEHKDVSDFFRDIGYNTTGFKADGKIISYPSDACIVSVYWTALKEEK